jgi:hypothetical protein
MRIYQIIVDALTAFVITAGGSLLVGFVSSDGRQVSATVWIISAVTGAIAAAKSTRNMLQLPPLNNGNYAAIAELMRAQPKNQNEKTPPPPPAA